ncbi:alpha-tocopherol transfer protein-like protein [Dinothrombium tinctorium]|uniref:Alpha-tocopherol transfer protein-like protein n=1 Tax=Dinothrombium tinctorium TaxID=1965070 RepID=A0A443QEU0_9ACAR|nr:alpha-tocopherol transfer protein-like protein [Dinothrombium tinctorium]RWS11484.1 alpha-tocopherol transfer protein-like protein [Dinothrombium tinctorium]
MAALSNVSVLSTIEANKQNYIGDLRAKLIAAGISIEFSDDFLIKFLRARLYNCDQTCDLIRTYLSNFQKHPEFFNGFQYVRQPLENGVFEILPDRNVTGETLILMRPGKWEPNLCAFNVATAATIYGVEMDKLSEESQISGTIEIIDMQDVGLKQFLLNATKQREANSVITKAIENM